MEQTSTSPQMRNISKAETELHEFIEQFAAAITRGNLDEIMSFYSDDVVAFDLVAPLEFVGKPKYRSIWKSTFTDVFKFPVGYDFEEQKIFVSGDVAFCHGLVYLNAEPRDGHGLMQNWMRNTLCMRKIGVEWFITHDHCSMPGNPETGMMEMKLKPSSEPH